MKSRPLLSLVRQNLRRNLASLLLSSLGIVVGIASLVFFLALGSGMKEIVLQRIFVVSHLEVVPRSYDVGILKLSGLSGLSRRLDDAALERLRRIDGVQAVYPKLRFAFKAMGWTAEELFGRAFYFEIFGDGIDPALVPELSQAPPGERFADLGRCGDGLPPCLDGLSCADGRCVGPVCAPRPSGSGSGSGSGSDLDPDHTLCPPGTHCLQDTRRCEPDIPVLISPHLIELYNGSAAGAFGLPKLAQDSIVGIRGTMRLGKSFAGRESSGPVRERYLQVVGLSPTAITFGVTMPISYVREFNSWYRKDEPQTGYDSVMVQVTANEKVPEVAAAIEDRSGEHGLGFELAPRSKDALQAGVMISVLTLVFSLISLIIVGLSAINIAHTFFMILSERRAEIGLLRALGATRADVRSLVLLESAAVGLLGGLGGWLLGTAATHLADLLSFLYLPDFPYKPDSYFQLSPRQLLLALGVAVAFCLLGAWLPARRAAAVDPAVTLTGR